MNYTGKRCLFISDRSFYSYAERIDKELMSLGFELTVCNHEYPDSDFGKILSKLRLPFPLLITRKIISQKYLNGRKYELILIIKGRGLSRHLLMQLKSTGTKVIAHNYDTFKFNRTPLNGSVRQISILLLITKMLKNINYLLLNCFPVYLRIRSPKRTGMNYQQF